MCACDGSHELGLDCRTWCLVCLYSGGMGNIENDIHFTIIDREGGMYVGQCLIFCVWEWGECFAPVFYEAKEIVLVFEPCKRI